MTAQPSTARQDLTSLSMENITITAQITYPKAEIEAFADMNGYFEVIQDQTDPSITTPNPESREDFVKRLFLEQSLEWFLKGAIATIRKEKNAETDAAIQAKKNELAQFITIN